VWLSGDAEKIIAGEAATRFATGSAFLFRLLARLLLEYHFFDNLPQSRGGPMPVDNDLYNRDAHLWWADTGSCSLLRTGLNPVRFAYFRQVLTDHLHGEPTGKRVLDIGCGGGLLAEEFARLGCHVVGIDPSPPSIAVAQAHARASGLGIEYGVAAGEQLPFATASFDIVVSVTSWSTSRTWTGCSQKPPGC
jgi:SAM-dependent methyltransferase